MGSTCAAAGALLTRRRFLQAAAAGAAAVSCLSLPSLTRGQEKGERPPAPPKGVTVLHPRGRTPVALIIDDSTCLANLNHFAVPQFAEAWQTQRQLGQAYNQPWREWPAEIPDAFVRKFGEWSRENGIKGKYSVVPYPACVGRLDRMLPGWTQAELRDSIKLVRELMTPNWDIHPEMVTHTWVIDLKTGHPYVERDLRHMENWEWTTGRSADEIAEYMRYALTILKNVGLPCEGITTPGGFGNKALASLSMGTLQAVRDVFGAEIPHYFRHLYDKGAESVAPRVEYASGLGGDNPKCSVSIIGCTGDWTGGWDCSKPEGPDRFITPDLKEGRVVEVIARGEPAVMVAHWTGIYYNGQETGFKIFQEVVRRLREKYGEQILWMKLAEISRYWAARELTAIDVRDGKVELNAPFSCPLFTVRIDKPAGGGTPAVASAKLERVTTPADLKSGNYLRDEASGALTCCFDLPKGKTTLGLSTPT